MGLQRKKVPKYDDNKKQWLGAMLRVDVVDVLGKKNELGMGLRQTSQSIHNNNVESQRSNPSVLIEFEPKDTGRRFASFVTEVIKALSTIQTRFIWLRPGVDEIGSLYRRATEARSIGVLKPSDSFLKPSDSFFGQVTEAGSTMAHSVSALRLWGHGNIGTGQPKLADIEITLKDVRDESATLLRLKPYFSRHPSTRFEFRGCRAATGEGLEIMKELAKLWGIRVHAADVNQPGMEWVGNVFEALPDGTLKKAESPLPYTSLY